MTSSSQPFKHIATGFRDRTFVTLRLASKLSMKMVKNTIGAAHGETPMDPAEAERKATALVEQRGKLKGLVMKFGQMASYLDGAFPPGAQRVLARLQSNSQPMDYACVANVLETECGASVAQFFDSFDTNAIASASIGQVHRASYAGKSVVVKVQYPGIEEVLKSDLSKVGALARLGMFAGSTDGKAIVNELRARILEECDYLAEAENQALYLQRGPTPGKLPIPS